MVWIFQHGQFELYISETDFYQTYWDSAEPLDVSFESVDESPAPVYIVMGETLTGAAFTCFEATHIWHHEWADLPVELDPYLGEIDLGHVPGNHHPGRATENPNVLRRADLQVMQRVAEVVSDREASICFRRPEDMIGCTELEWNLARQGFSVFELTSSGNDAWAAWLYFYEGEFLGAYEQATVNRHLIYRRDLTLE